jgi:hypothetical protein
MRTMKEIGCEQVWERVCIWLFISLNCIRFSSGLMESFALVRRIDLAPLPSCMGFSHEMRIDKDIQYHYKGEHLDICALVFHCSSCEADATTGSAINPVLREDN